VQHGYPVRIGTLEDGPWRKAEAVRRALTGSNADVLVVADGDVWCDGIGEAIALAADGTPWVIPHRRVHRLTREATRDVLGGVEPNVEMPVCHSEVITVPYTGVPGGGIVVVRREVYERCPLDPRFAGWGQEDEAWGQALTALYGRPAPLDYPLWHLWHPPQPLAGKPKDKPDPSMVLYGRYEKARKQARRDGGESMRALLAEAKEVVPC
jgi:hypothetical protein